MMARSTLNRRDRGRAASMKLQAKMAEGHWTPLAALQAAVRTHTCPPVPRRPARQAGTVVGRPDPGLPTGAPFPTGPSIVCIRCRRGCGDAHGEHVLICDRRQPAAGQHEKPKRGHSGSRRAGARLDFLQHLAELREHLGGQEPFTLALGVLDHRAAGIASLRYQTPASRHPDNFPDHNPLQTLMVRCRPTPKA